MMLVAEVLEIVYPVYRGFARVLWCLQGLHGGFTGGGFTG